MNEWMKNEKWRKKFKNIYFMRNHNYAFSAWEIERMQNGISENATLFHVDSHLDDSTDAIGIPGVLEDFKSINEAIVIADEFDYSNDNTPDRQYMKIDNFIWPAIMKNTIGDVIYISDDDSQKELNEKSLKEILRNSTHDYFRFDKNGGFFEEILVHLQENKKIISRYQSLEQHEHEKEQFFISIDKKSTILDLDLDYFNDSNIWGENPNLKNEEQIVRNLEYLKNLNEWDVITVALSPEYCGGEDACNYLFELFLECFNIDENELIDW